MERDYDYGKGTKNNDKKITKSFEIESIKILVSAADFIDALPSKKALFKMKFNKHLLILDIRVHK